MNLSVWIKTSAIFLTVGFVSIGYTNCNQYEAINPERKREFLNNNHVFSSAVTDNSGIKLVSMGAETFDGMVSDGVNQNDGAVNGGVGQNDGAVNGGVGQNDGGGASSPNQNDGGIANGGSSQNDGGTTGGATGPDYRDKWDPNDPGNLSVTVPQPGSPDDPNWNGGNGVVNGIGINMNSGLPRVKACVQENTQPGFQFLGARGVTYSACGPCEVVDRINGACLVVVSPPVANNGRGFNGGDGDPLVIDVIGDKGGIANMELSAPKDGVLFDLFGQRARPQANQKVTVSWTNNPRYKYLVLPDVHGKVLGINELFGDSTLGPDGRYSMDGFHALHKYDGMDARGKVRIRTSDNKIDKNDGVFSHLRLWLDANSNGLAEANELTTMAQEGIQSIDIKYDPTFYEKDIYGNEAIFKSVVQFKDGHIGMVFDLWFKPLEGKSQESSATVRGPASIGN